MIDAHPLVCAVVAAPGFAVLGLLWPVTVYRILRWQVRRRQGE